VSGRSWLLLAFLTLAFFAMYREGIIGIPGLKGERGDRGERGTPVRILRDGIGVNFNAFVLRVFLAWILDQTLSCAKVRGVNVEKLVRLDHQVYFNEFNFPCVYSDKII
jgi:hypothetical protein